MYAKFHAICVKHDCAPQTSPTILHVVLKHIRYVFRLGRGDRFDGDAASCNSPNQSTSNGSTSTGARAVGALTRMHPEASSAAAAVEPAALPCPAIGLISNTGLIPPAISTEPRSEKQSPGSPDTVGADTEAASSSSDDEASNASPGGERQAGDVTDVTDISDSPVSAMRPLANLSSSSSTSSV